MKGREDFALEIGAQCKLMYPNQEMTLFKIIYKSTKPNHSNIRRILDLKISTF